ncbi:hypothetical protein [Streptomyces sp. Ncost-T10-10d]|uniref:hypothetical protein n=1 Tax=Streptomyces sp. Ncost-T10-10d TaxID=1839774 RepID=UPI00081F2190|nr:hypothetical protein [Streptomyces sp. Ncost-T10-10d]SCF87771.1 hypothetical protein GA0115254_121013 [Streptomyces sp. Ncost-T10-10d]
MSSLVLLVVLLLVLVTVLGVGFMAYLAHRHPAAATPLVVATGGAALMVACVVPIAIR